MNPYTKLTLTCTSLLLVMGASGASAANITWLSMAPTPFGSTVPNNSVFNLPGVGNVTVSYSIPSGLVQTRGQNVVLTSGSAGGGGGVSWTNWEQLGVTNNLPNPPFVNTPWSVTYTFSGTVPAGVLYVGAAGLGKTSSFGGGATTVTVNQNGTFIGDWSGGGPYGATQFTGGVGTFSMENSVTGIGGQDPWWNSKLGVVRINDPVSSLTIFANQLPGDGMGVNIAAVPEPASLLLIAGGSLLLVRRRHGLMNSH